MENDLKYADLIRAGCYSGDVEQDHATADDFLTDLLTELGYSETVLAFNRVEKWYA